MPTNDIGVKPEVNNMTEWMPLRCGPLSLHFDPATGALRNIQAADREVVRGIYIAVRDCNWGTVTPQLTALRAETDVSGFRLTVNVACREREIDFSWRGEITGDASGTIRFHMEGQANSTFQRNRIGLCVLHPIQECAGQPCRVQSVAGTISDSVFPDLIAPHQPFLGMRSIAYGVCPGVWAELSFEGDIFEMEDQRNWTDASFKTYSTPLELPYPVEVRAGTRIVQTVTLKLTSEESALAFPSAPECEPHSRLSARQILPTHEPPVPITLRFGNAAPIPLPAIGLGVASHGTPLSLREIECLKRLSLSHLRLDLIPSLPGWEMKLAQAVVEAEALGAGLEIALFLTANAEAELSALVTESQRLQPFVVRWLLFSCTEKTTPEGMAFMARKHLQRVTPQAQPGGGTNAYFAELNRGRPPLNSLECICYSVNPQVHAFDTASLMENLEAQAETVRSARALYPCVPIVISPVTLKPRFNPDAATGELTRRQEELPPSVDARQCALTGAGWTLGSLKALCESEVHSVTYYETTGWRGVMETEAGSPLPESFPSTPGMLFPLYHVFADIGKFAGGETTHLESSAPGHVTGMALRSGRRRAVLCANLTPETQQVRLLVSAPATSLSLWRLDAHSVERCLQTPDHERPLDSGKALNVHNGVAQLELTAFAYARLEWEE